MNFDIKIYGEMAKTNEKSGKVQKKKSFACFQFLILFLEFQTKLKIIFWAKSDLRF